MSYKPLSFKRIDMPAAIPQRESPDVSRLDLDEPAMAAVASSQA